MLLIADYKKNNGENNTYNTKNLLVLLEQKLMSVYKNNRKNNKIYFAKNLLLIAKTYDCLLASVRLWKFKNGGS